MKKFKIVFLGLFFFTFIVISCTTEEKDTIAGNDTIVAATTIDAINEMDIKIGRQVDYENSVPKKSAKGAASFLSNCTIITMQNPSVSFPKVFFIDFGTSCSINKITRKGKLKITFSNHVTAPGSSMKIERENYYINNIKAEGTIDYVNSSPSSGLTQWTKTVTGGKITDANGNVYFNSGIHTVKQTAGINTLTLDDNVYEISQGTHKVNKEKGAVITLTVRESLLKKHTCEYLSKGKIKVEGSILDGVIDYGNNQCDNLATYTQNGVVFNFAM